MTQPAPGKPVVPSTSEEDESVTATTLQAAIDVTDTLEADDPVAAAAVRQLCMAVATDLGLSDAIPDNWNTDGSVGDLGSGESD